MELSAKYVYKIYEKRSFSAAAKAMFVSQPALSASVARLEKDLGFQIFDRSTVPLSLTPEGRIYMDSLEEILESERTMKHRLRDLSEMNYGNLSVGGSVYAAYHLLPFICRRFYHLYPNIRVNLDLGNVGSFSNLLDKLRKRELDLIIAYDGDHGDKDLESIPILEERLLIAVHRSVQGAEELAPYALTKEQVLRREYPKEKEMEDLSMFRDIPFLSFEKGSNTQKRMDALLSDHLLSPYTIYNARNSTVHYNMMRLGLGAILAMDCFAVDANDPEDDILYFVPKSQNSHRTLYLIGLKGSGENRVIKRFSEVALDVCASDEWKHFFR